MSIDIKDGFETFLVVWLCIHAFTQPNVRSSSKPTPSLTFVRCFFVETETLSFAACEQHKKCFLQFAVDNLCYHKWDEAWKTLKLLVPTADCHHYIFFCFPSRQDFTNEITGNVPLRKHTVKLNFSHHQQTTASSSSPTSSLSSCPVSLHLLSFD